MLVKVQKKFLPAKSDLVAAFAEVLKEEPTKILYDKSRVYLTYQVDVGGQGKTYEQQVYERLMEVRLEEMDGQHLLSNYANIYCQLASYQLLPTHVLVGDKWAFLKWAGVQQVDLQKVDYFFGSRIIQSGEVEGGVAIFILSDKPQADLPDFKSAVKIQIPFTEEYLPENEVEGGQEKVG